MFFQKPKDVKETGLARALIIRHDHLLNFSEESIFEGTDRTFSNVFIELPYPIHKALKSSEDLVLKLLKEKTNYHTLLEAKKRRYKRHDKKLIDRQEYAGHKYIYLPQHLLDLYNVKDPDPSFNSDYNYYYTGGNLEHFEFNNNDYLVRPDIDNNLCVNNVSGEDDNVIKVNYKAESTIFNIDSAKTYNELFFTLREKQRISVVRCDDINKVTLKYSHLHKQSVLDAKLSEDMKLGMIFSHAKFSIKDIETSGTILSFKNNLEGNVDNFQQFKFLDENTVALMDRNKVKILDIRSKTEDTMCFEPKLLHCTPFYNFTILDNTLLVASRHYIIKTDIRNFESVFHYSHSLSEAPCYIDYALKDSDTYLGLSGQNYDSRVLFTGKAPYSLPFKIPSLKRTVIETKMENPSLVLEDQLETKAQYSLTGFKILEVDNDISIFTSNCFGEIFKQNIYEKQPDNSIPIKMLNKWHKTIEQTEHNLCLTNFEEVSDIRFSLNSAVYDSELTRYERPGRENKFLKKFEPMYSARNIKSQLGKDFLDIWEDDDDDEEEEIEEMTNEKTLDKVKSWIQTHDFETEED